MLVLGCTGGIGSGKSYVASVFERLGYPVYYSDIRTKELYDKDATLIRELKVLLGEEIIENGRVNRAAMAAKIFTEKKLLFMVERFVHPAFLRDFLSWKEEIAARENAPKFVLLESAILLEKEIVKDCVDKVLTISAPLELRIERVMKRDGVSREKVLERMQHQWNDYKREQLANFVIFADEKRALLPDILKIISELESI